MNADIIAQNFKENQTIYIYQKGQGEYIRSLGFSQKLEEEVYEIKFEGRLQKVRSSHCFEIDTLKTFRQWTLGNVSIEVQPDPLKLTYFGDMISVQEGDKWYQVKRFFNGNQLPLDWDNEDISISERLVNWFKRLQAQKKPEKTVETGQKITPEETKPEKTAQPKPNSETINIIQSSEQVEKKGFVELLKDLRDPKPAVQIKASKQLGIIGNKEATPSLVKGLETSNPKVRAAIVEALCQIKDPRSYKYFIHLLKDYEADVRFYAVTGLGELGNAKALEHVRVMLNNENDKRVKSRALETFGKLTRQ